MAQRNYPCDNIIFTYFGQMDLSGVGEQEFKKQLYVRATYSCKSMSRLATG